MTRDFNASDLERVRSLHERSFSFPDLDSKLYVISKVVEREGRIVGFGTIRLTSEAIIVLDGTQPKRVRVGVIEDLLHAGVEECQKLGIDEMHTFLTGCDDESFARILERKFGFVKCKGTPLTRLL